MADWSIPFIAFSLIILVVIGILLIIARKRGTGQQVSPYAMLGMLFIILGIVFGSDRLIGYAFLGAGVLIAVFDVVKNRQKK
jgi:cytochrome c biogenesis factor